MNATNIFWLAVGAGVVAALLLGYGFYAEVIAQKPRDSVAWSYWFGAVLAVVAGFAGILYLSVKWGS